MAEQWSTLLEIAAHLQVAEETIHRRGRHGVGRCFCDSDRSDGSAQVEVQVWLDTTKTELLTKLKAGPVRV